MNELEKAAKKHRKMNSRKNQLGWFQTFVGDAEIEADFFNHCNASESPSVNPTGPMGEGYDVDGNHIIRKYMRDWTFDEAQEDYYNSTLGMYLREYERMHEVDEDEYFLEARDSRFTILQRIGQQLAGDDFKFVIRSNHGAVEICDKQSGKVYVIVLVDSDIEKNRQSVMAVRDTGSNRQKYAGRIKNNDDYLIVTREAHARDYSKHNKIIYKTDWDDTTPEQIKNELTKRINNLRGEDVMKESVNGSVEDFYSKMVGKTKPEVEKVVLAAKGNPNADIAYKRWLANNTLTEELDETVELVYDQLEIEVNVGSPSGYYDVGYGNWLPDDRYETRYVDVTLEKDADDIIEYLVDWALADGIITAEEDEEIYKYAEEHFDELVEKYYDKLLDKYEDDAIEAAYDKVDLYEGKFDLREALNNVDLKTNNKYDLRNMYDASSLTEEKKMKLAHMLKENVAPEKLYEYFSFDDEVDEQDYRIGLTLFAEGREYKVLNVLDTKEVDGYELAIVYALPEDTNNLDEAYFVLLNNDIEWGPCDTAEECSEWWEDVTDGYYDGDDDYDPDDDYGEW